MLKHIDPLLTPALLQVLAEMGHGDEIAVVDANFPAASVAGRQGRLLRLAGCGLVRACDAVLSLLPLESQEEHPVACMRHAGLAAGQVSPLHQQVLEVVQRQAGLGAARCQALAREAFYERAGAAWAVVQTAELQPFGNFLFRKGVILAD